MNQIELIKELFPEVKNNEIKRITCKGIVLTNYYVSNSGIVFSLQDKEIIKRTPLTNTSTEV